MDAIAVHNVTKRYGNFTAVSDLSFEVERGEIFAMLGPNGAGKTTTLRMILDILKPDTGAIEVLGGPITDATKEHIGYLPEERGLYRNIPVIDVLTYLGTLKGMGRQAAHKEAMKMLEQVELGENAKNKVSELSKGMQQKVQLITAFLHHPELVIVDEPFAGLDPVNAQLIKDMLYQMRGEGVTIVMSTHQMPQVEEMADRLVMIDHGHRVLYGGVDEVRQRFAKNAIVVEGEGDWAALAGVKSVETGENGREVLLHLADNVTPDDVIGAMAASAAYHVRRFELAVPSLNEIFIEVAGNGNHHADHQGDHENGGEG
jgi:ABC-2 type transport system ATP-binding protein